MQTSSRFARVVRPPSAFFSLLCPFSGLLCPIPTLDRPLRPPLLLGISFTRADLTNVNLKELKEYDYLQVDGEVFTPYEVSEMALDLNCSSCGRRRCCRLFLICSTGAGVDSVFSGTG